jgi:hypothetical protein
VLQEDRSGLNECEKRSYEDSCKKKISSIAVGLGLILGLSQGRMDKCHLLNVWTQCTSHALNTHAQHTHTPSVSANGPARLDGMRCPPFLRTLMYLTTHTRPPNTAHCTSPESYSPGTRNAGKSNDQRALTSQVYDVPRSSIAKA